MTFILIYSFISFSEYSDDNSNSIVCARKNLEFQFLLNKKANFSKDENDYWIIFLEDGNKMIINNELTRSIKEEIKKY